MGLRLPSVHLGGGAGDALHLLSGVLNASGANQLLPGGGLQDFAQTLQQDPRAAGQQYAAFRGPLLSQDAQMQLPIGPWGSPMGSLARTGPARSMQAKFQRQAMLDMYRDATKGIDKVATSGFLENHIDVAQKEVAMQRMGMGRDELQNRNLMRKTRELAFEDQDRAAWDGLQSLLPPSWSVQGMPPQLQGTLRTLLTNAKEQVADRMYTQKRNRGGRIERGGTAPEKIEEHRGYVTRALDQNADKHPIDSNDQLLRLEQSNRVRSQKPGLDLDRAFVNPITKQLNTFKGKRGRTT